jgi:tetratricopeptide (TPR) repeat protein
MTSDISGKKKKFIKRNYPRLSVNELAEQLGLKEKEILLAIEQLGLEKREETRPPISLSDKPFRIPLISIVLIIVISAFVYTNSLNNSFNFDDATTIIENMGIRHLGDLKSIYQSNRARPLLMFSFALNYYFGKEKPFGYHVANLILHALNGIFIYIIIFMTLFLGSGGERSSPGQIRLIALVSSLLFLSHPVHTESVTFISSRSSMLCTCFYLLAILLYIEARGRGQFIYYLAFSIFSFLLALATKELAATLPIILLLYEYIFISKGDRKEFYRACRQYLWPFFLVIGLFLIYRFSFLPPAKTSGSLLSPYVYLLNEFHVIVNYLRLLVFPVNLNVDPDFPIAKTLFEPPIAISMVALAALAMVAVIRFNRSPTISFCLLWYFITLVPTSSINPLLDVMAEHRVYLPSVGLCIFSGIIVNRISGLKFIGFPYSRMKKIILSLFLVVLVFNSLGTIKRNFIWSDDLSLWEDTAKKSPRKWRVLGNLGLAYEERGMLDRAVLILEDAVRVNPTYTKAFNTLGVAYMKKGMIDLAIAKFKRSLQLNPNYTEAHYNLGLAYEQKGLPEEARKEFDEAIRSRPGDAVTHNKWGLIYLGQGEYDEAIAEFKQALQTDPGFKFGYINLGLAYKRQGLLDEAIEQYQKALEIDPNDFNAHLNLGNAYGDEGQLDEAIEQYQAALRTSPSSEKAHNNLGLVYYRKKMFDRSLAEFKETLRINPNYADAHKNLGIIYYYHIKDMNSALQHFRRSLELKPNQKGAEELKKLIRSH